jgi:alkanesulfonate monooxygenase SsuD/methylene tetrahydromethanopterin reductase-like flavin-dependent oxidoreductase (luciferase family)
VGIGYWLSSEEHSPRTLVENARRAEDAGFSYLLISDHIHPWVDAQGHSPFVWGVIGAIGEATERLRLGTAVTCPLIRRFERLGFTHLCLHDVSENQREFIEFARQFN